MRESIKLKKESSQVLLAGRTPKPAEGYQLAKWPATLAGNEANAQMWEEFVG